ncbi:opioid growth factor receptor-related protein [Halomonas salifodinae]|uniref:Opioid growth factor receptor-related protein n=1 Tax=Halomonas salifodinae TaxID=438745 RepID=A0ABW2EXU7_9GAMM
MEHTHDYIQWLFPIPEAGRFNGFAPLLVEEARIAFADDESLRVKQRRSLDVMLAFFGLARRERIIDPLADLNMGEHIWLKRGGHNHLRISRIIRSLHLCHQPELAAAFQHAVITTQGVVSEQSLGYWRAATQT